MEIETYEDILQEKDEVSIEEYYEIGRQIYDDFDTAAYRKGHGYTVSGFPIFNKKLEGLEEGLYIFGGESNSGKTAIVTNLIWQIANCPDNHLFGIYYSLDDSTNEVIARLIAMNQQIPISVASKPKRYEDFAEANKNTETPVIQQERDICLEYLERRKQGLQELKDANEHFLIQDAEKIPNLEQLLDHMKKVQLYVKSFNPENNIIVAIDSIADIAVSSQKFNTDRERIDYVARTIKKAANVDLKIPVFGTYHLRKLNHNGRPTLDDIKESGRLVYEASMVFLVFNDVSKNKEAANVFSSLEDCEYKQPIIELDWAKNKKSSYKGRTYHYFIPDCSKVMECGEAEHRRYDALIYSK